MHRGLICLLTKPTLELQISRIKVSCGAPPIGQLLFADNSVLFCKADACATRKIKKVLEIYKKSLQIVHKFRKDNDGI